MEKLSKKFALLLGSAVGLLGMVSCSYNHKNYEYTGYHFDSPDNSPDNYVIQVDDYGEFWDPQAAETALSAIRKSAAQTNTVVVLFIHGWHHNAKPGNDNLVNFANSLKNLREKLHDNPGGKPGVYRGSRKELTGDGEVRVIGVYVGWRGRSLPGFLDYGTFWGRKAAAERVGEGDLRGFMTSLQDVYTMANAPDPAREKKPFMGLVSVGHSFGGQALFRATESTFERELLAAAKRAPAAPSHAFEPISGYGDLVVLVNPALEAYQYRRIHTLSRKLRYDHRQPPVLLVLSESSDLPRRVFFPAGRTIDSAFRAPFRPGQWDQWTTALGEYEGQRTHEIDRDTTGASKLFDASIYADRPCEVIHYDLTNVPSIGEISLNPTGVAQPHNPFVVAYAKEAAKLIKGHTGLFNMKEARKEVEVALEGFLNDYVAMVEGKRILLRTERLKSCSVPSVVSAAQSHASAPVE